MGRAIEVLTDINKFLLKPTLEPFKTCSWKGWFRWNVGWFRWNVGWNVGWFGHGFRERELRSGKELRREEDMKNWKRGETLKD